MVVVLEHQHAATAGDDEAVAGGVVGARGRGGCFVVVGGQRAHRVELQAQRPVQFFAAAGEHDVLAAGADKVGSGADAVRRSRAGGRNRIAGAADAESGGQVGRHRRTHGARHHVGADLAHAAVAQQVRRFDLPLGRTTAGTREQAGAVRAHLGIVQAGVGDRVLHGHVRERGTVTHETQDLAVDARREVDVRRAGHLAAQAGFHRRLVAPDAGKAAAKRRRNPVKLVAQARDDAHARNRDAPHDYMPSVEENRPTRSSSAV